MNLQAQPHRPVSTSGGLCYRPLEGWPALPAALTFTEVAGVACDSRDRVYLFVRGPQPILILDPAGNFLGTWGEGVFVRPHGITIGPDDVVYCSDDCDHTVRAFTTAGQLLFTMGTSGQPSATGATSLDYRTIQRAGPPFHYPTNLAVAPSGELYISDGYGNARIHRFTATGQLLQSWGAPGAGPGEFHLPHGIAVDAEGIVYVADRENSRIQLFTPEGGFISEWTDVARPTQVFVDPAGLVQVSELGFRCGRWPGTGEAPAGAPGGRVSIFDRAGQLLARWGGGDNPCAPGDFFAPHDLCADSAGNLYVAEVTWSAGGCNGVVPASCHSIQKFAPAR